MIVTAPQSLYSAHGNKVLLCTRINCCLYQLTYISANICTDILNYNKAQLIKVRNKKGVVEMSMEEDGAKGDEIDEAILVGKMRHELLNRALCRNLTSGCFRNH